MLLLDASVWIAAKDRGDRYFEPSRELAIDPIYPVAALDLTLYEVANALGIRRQASGQAADVCRLITARCAAELVSVTPAVIESTLSIAAEHGLTAYDAAYVAAAQHHGWTLVSADIADLVSKGLAVTPDAAVYP
jgi:predicted nucleic acid-binding protein